MPADWQYLDLGDIATYPAFAAKAAILCARIIQNHPPPDGNKRKAFICMVEFIERNGRLLQLGVADTADRVADVLVDLATHGMSEGEFVAWVAERLQP